MQKDPPQAGLVSSGGQIGPQGELAVGRVGLSLGMEGVIYWHPRKLPITFPPACAITGRSTNYIQTTGRLFLAVI